MAIANKTGPSTQESETAQQSAAPKMAETAPGLRVQETVASDALAEESTGAATQKVIQDSVSKETDRGFRGVKVDPTPNENYTVAGVTNPDKHVPEEFKIRTGALVLPDVHPDAKK